MYDFIEEHHLWGYVWMLAFIIGLLIIAYIISCIRAVVKRIIFIEKLKTTGCKLYPAHRLWYFGGLKGKKCDFYIDLGDTVLSVKLIGRLWSGTSYAVATRNQWCRQHTIYMVLGSILTKFPLGWHKLRIPDYNFRYNIPEELKSKRIVEVLTFQPVPYELKANTSKKSRDLYSGEVVDGLMITSGGDIRNIAETGVFRDYVVRQGIIQ